MELEFRAAKTDDLDRIFAMYSAAIQEMKRNGIEQWDEIYPDRDILEEDIKKHQLFIGCIGTELACAYVLNEECDEDYKNGSWCCPEDSYLVIHRLCVNPAFQKQGLGGRTLAHIEEAVRGRGKTSIRLDAFPPNIFAIRMYEKRDYRKTGFIDLRKGRFYLMEKEL